MTIPYYESESDAISCAHPSPIWSSFGREFRVESDKISISIWKHTYTYTHQIHTHYIHKQKTLPSSLSQNINKDIDREGVRETERERAEDAKYIITIVWISP